MSTQSNQSRSKGQVKGKVSPQEWAAKGASTAEGTEGTVQVDLPQEKLDLGQESTPVPEKAEKAVTQEPESGKQAPTVEELASRMVRMEQAVKGLRREVTTSAELLDQSMELKCKDVLDHVSYQGRRIGHIERELNIVPSTTTTTLANEEEHIMENVIAGQEQVVAGQETDAEQKAGMLKRLASSTTSKVVLGVVGVGAAAAVGYYAYTKLSHKDETAALTDLSNDPMATPAMSYDNAPEATRY